MKVGGWLEIDGEGHYYLAGFEDFVNPERVHVAVCPFEGELEDYVQLGEGVG